MKFELTVYELSKVLKLIEEKYDVRILIKKEIVGGWMTIIGKVKIESEAIEGAGCNGKYSNILSIKVIEENSNGISLKLTGAKNKKFDVEIASTKFRQLSPLGLNQNKIKINEDESKLRIDKDIIFTINEKASNICNIIADICSK